MKKNTEPLKDQLSTCLSRIDGLQGELEILGLPLAEIVSQFRYARWANALWGVYASETQASSAAFLKAQDWAWERLIPVRQRLARSEDAISALRLGLEYVGAETPVAIAMTLMMSLFGYLRPESEGLANTALAQDPLERLMWGLFPLEQPEILNAKARALEIYLLTVSDHGFNASTYTARVIASTGSDFRACVQGALGALQGPLHGGAPGPVLDMLDAVAAAESAEAWVLKQLQQGKRMMGFGHRIYRARDPRADVLKAALVPLRGQGIQRERLEQAESLEAVVLQVLHERKPGRVLQTNVEYYTALLLEAIGFSREVFTAVFALGRVLGWCAHVQEQRAIGRLIRPSGHFYNNDSVKKLLI